MDEKHPMPFSLESVIKDYSTQDLYFVCSGGIYHIKLKS